MGSESAGLALPGSDRVDAITASEMVIAVTPNSYFFSTKTSACIISVPSGCGAIDINYLSIMVSAAINLISYSGFGIKCHNPI